MRKFSFLYAVLFLGMITISCGTAKTTVEFVPEESGLNIQKITDESKNSVLGQQIVRPITSFFVQTAVAGSKRGSYFWSTPGLLCMSPDGNQIAYLSKINKQDNIMIRRTTFAGTSTQRTFRNVGSFTWGADGYLYFSDYIAMEKTQINSMNATSGSAMRQITNNSMDSQPAISRDGEVLYFTRIDNNGPSIWMYDLKNNTLTSCARGFNACPAGNGHDQFYCTRNSADGMSEIWHVNFVSGIETLVYSDKNHGYSNPQLSPDGQWILMEGDSKSGKGVKNLDIFVVKTDGTGFMQLTYHPSLDCCPVWSTDGKSIFFISSRGNTESRYNIWKMSFNL